MHSLAFCSNPGMDISDIWDAHLRAIVDDLAPGDASVRGLKRPAFKEVAARTRKSAEYVYQVYSGIKRVGPDFASALDREFANGRAPGWINVSLQASAEAGAPDELAFPDDTKKRGGLGLNEFLNYLNSFNPTGALTPQEIKEEADAYQKFAAERLANRLLKQRFQTTGVAPDARVEAAYAEAQRRERRQAPPPDEQLVDSPMAGRQRRSTDKKSGAS
jgi:hypothetical protein